MPYDDHVTMPRSLAEDGRRWRAAVPSPDRRKPEGEPFVITAGGRWCREELARYTYKPNVRMWISELASPTFGNPVFLNFEAMVLDSRGDSVKICPVVGREAVPPDLVDGDTPSMRSTFFGLWLKSVLDGFENHELREWLRRDGELVDDPHAKPVVKLNDSPAPTIKVDE